jgi:hypothetical protein
LLDIVVAGLYTITKIEKRRKNRERVSSCDMDSDLEYGASPEISTD